MINAENRILVVDDSDDNRDAVAELLSSNGYLVDKAGSGKEALLKMAGHAPDLFLLDVVMPEMTGLDLLREVRVNDNEYEVIMMTGFESLEDAKKAMQLGAFSYVAKPLRWEVLKDQVDQALNIVRVKKERLLHLAALEKEVQKRNSELRSTVHILESQGRRLDAIINGMEEGLLAIDDRDCIVLMNAQAEKITGARFGVCAGERFDVAIADPEIAVRLSPFTGDRPMERALDNIVSWPLHGNGERFYHVNSMAVTGINGTFAGRVITFLDQTDKIKADQLRTSFLSIVAHELRTPVTIINNYLTVMDGAEHREAVDDMKTACFRLGNLIQSLVSLASLSNASISANWCLVNIAELVALQGKKFRNAAASKKISIEIENNLNSPVVNSDPQLLGIALGALLDNAVKFSMPGGNVGISLDEQTHGGLSRYSISITDSGKGIDERVRGRMFENFTQGEDHLTRHYPGLGTGLFLAKRAIELLDGWIDAGAAEGGGSRFTLILPWHNQNTENVK